MMPQGGPIFELDDVRITAYVAQFGGTSYQIPGISSVRAIQAKRLSRLAGYICVIIGCGLFVAAFVRSGNETQADANFPVAVTSVGIMFLSLLIQGVLPRRVFKLILRTHGSDIEVLTSSQKNYS
jgi:hypothetical protein